jgi:tRNA(Ile)-lysidine synthase
MAPGLLTRFGDHLEHADLLAGPAPVIVAVSGGADSLALLDLLHGVAAVRGLSLIVAHADHGIHGASAQVAADVVRISRDRYGLETVVGRLGLGAQASETRAREARYEFLREVQAVHEARWLTTGHHADDQAETVLLRLLRGSGPAGLAGMAPSGPGGLVRPLLPFTRAELDAHVRSIGLVPHEDPANANPHHMRSWVRGALLPLLEDRLAGEARDALLSVARHGADEIAAWDAALDLLPALEIEAKEGRVHVARAALSGYDSLLAARLLRAAARRAGLLLAPAPAQRIVAFAPGAGSGRVLGVGDGLVAEAAFDRLILRRETADAPDARAISGDAGTETFGPFRISWRREAAPAHLEREGWTTWITPGSLELRPPPPGARIRPLGGTGRRPVAKLFMEGRVARGDREQWPALVRNGETVWIPGVCRADAAIPEPGTFALRLDVAATG